MNRTAIWTMLAAVLLVAPLDAGPVKRRIVSQTLAANPEVAALRRRFGAADAVYATMRARHAAGAVNRLVARATPGGAATADPGMVYAEAWLDLANGPVTLTVPDLGKRYASAALTTILGETVAVFGTRGGNGRFTLAGPGFAGAAPAGTTLARLPGNDARLLVRVQLDGADDRAAAGAALDRFALAGGGAPVPTVAVPVANPGAGIFLRVVREALARSNLAPGTPIGSAAARAAVDGWAEDSGLDALPRQELVALSARSGSDGAPLGGAKAYTVRIPPRPPAGFWSLTLYRVAPDGRLALHANEMNRFRIAGTDRATHLERDGGLDIFVQVARPGGERVVNWLPAPPGPFRLVWRAYLPGAALLDGGFRLAPVAVTEAVP